ncbi:hypothetical protein [Burkholderia sp. Ac-20365]|uniref:hypothetical protein n=1 Tax=Burkholderia sp. Ac-20365 TaxID=2703897 RepID=UPI00197C0FBA|nr:hypothetical protein [Burkholderia sp. Ac-20365]MBN3761143.1 hypothetical protein [Burkholderia sp. Ac-20365]
MSHPTGTVCPACQKKEGVPLLYGFPSTDDFERAARGEVILGGCVVDFDSADQKCRKCDHSWSSTDIPAVIGSDEKELRREPQTLLARDGVNSSSGGTSRALPTSTADPRGKEPGRAAHPKKVSVLPAVAAFFLALIFGRLFVGAAACADGWRSGSIGHAGACSHHGGVDRLPGILLLLFSYCVALAFHRYRARRNG